MAIFNLAMILNLLPVDLSKRCDFIFLYKLPLSTLPPLQAFYNALFSEEGVCFLCFYYYKFPAPFAWPLLVFGLFYFLFISHFDRISSGIFHIVNKYNKGEKKKKTIFRTWIILDKSFLVKFLDKSFYLKFLYRNEKFLKIC